MHHYSINNDGKCCWCKFDDIRALSIDHINGGGTQHRKTITTDFYYWLLENLPIDYQTLCLSCNFIKRYVNNELVRPIISAELADVSGLEEMSYKQCFRCKIFKTVDSFHKCPKYTKGVKGLHPWCKKCKSDNAREKHRDLKLDVINHYGGECRFCGEDDWRALAIDHIFGGGYKHRKKIGANGILPFLKKNNYPQDLYQLLCANCNIIKVFENNEHGDYFTGDLSMYLGA